MAPTLYQPSTMRTAGNVALIITPSVDDITAPTVAELEAGVAIQCATRGWGGSTTVQKNSDQYLCQTESVEETGQRTRTLTAIEVDMANPANAGTDALLAVVEEDAIVYVIERPGIAHDTAPAAAQEVDVWKVRIASIDRKAYANNSTDKFGLVINVDVLERELFAQVGAA